MNTRNIFKKAAEMIFDESTYYSCWAIEYAKGNTNCTRGKERRNYESLLSPENNRLVSPVDFDGGGKVDFSFKHHRTIALLMAGEVLNDNLGVEDET